MPRSPKRQRANIKNDKKKKKLWWTHTLKIERLSSFSVFSSALKQAIHGCGCACFVFFASVKAIECHRRSSRVNKANHMPCLPYLSRASRDVFGCGFRFFGLSPSSPRWWESNAPPVYTAPTPLDFPGFTWPTRSLACSSAGLCERTERCRSRNQIWLLRSVWNTFVLLCCVSLTGRICLQNCSVLCLAATTTTKKRTWHYGFIWEIVLIIVSQHSPLNSKSSSFSVWSLDVWRVWSDSLVLFVGVNMSE